MAEPIETPIGLLTADRFRPVHICHQVVVGPKFLYALFNPGDRMHIVSRAFMTFVRDGDLPYRQLIVNDHIVDEAATRLKKKVSLRNAAEFLITLEESDLYQFENVSEGVFMDAKQTFIEWTDLDAAFTDFVVAAQMSEMVVEHIVTYDQHYGAFELTTLPYGH